MWVLGSSAAIKLRAEAGGDVLKYAPKETGQHARQRIHEETPIYLPTIPPYLIKREWEDG